MYIGEFYGLHNDSPQPVIYRTNGDGMRDMARLPPERPLRSLHTMRKPATGSSDSGRAWGQQRLGSVEAMSPPVTLPSSAASPSAASHAYQKAAVELDDLLDQALGDFRGGSALGSAGDRGSVASSVADTVDSVGHGGSSVSHGEEVADEGAFVAASRQERYRSLLAFHRWCWLLCSVEPSFLTPKRKPQADSWMLSTAFHAWVVTGSHSAARSRSRPTSPVDCPDRTDNGTMSATFGAWASEARRRVQERVSLLSSVIGLWCAHTQQARHERELAAAADEISRERLLARQVLVMWAAVAAECAKQERAHAIFAERWSAKMQLCHAFNFWRSFSARGEADSMANAGEGSDLASRQKDHQCQSVDLDSFTGDWNRQCANDSVSPIAPMPSGTAFSLASPGADAEAAAESTQSTRQNPALDALDDLLHVEADMRKLVAKADRFCASRQSVRMVFFFTLWAQLRGSMTPRERQPVRTTSTTPDPVQTQTPAEVERSPARSVMQAQPRDHQPQEEHVAQPSDVPNGSIQKRSMDVERWLMRQAGVISSSDGSSDENGDGDDDDDDDDGRFQGGLWDDDEDLRMVATAEFAVAAMIEAAAPAAAAVLDGVDEQDDAERKQQKHEELVDLSGTVLANAAEAHVLSNSLERQLIELNKPEPVRAHAQPELESDLDLELEPEPEPELQPGLEPQLTSVEPVLNSFTKTTHDNSNCSVNVADDDDDDDDGDISMSEYMRDWVEWYFRGEWWPAPDVDVAVDRLFMQLSQRMRIFSCAVLSDPDSSASVPFTDKEACDTELSWPGYLAATGVWYLKGDWWIHVARAPETVPDMVTWQVVHGMALARYTGRLAMVRLHHCAVVSGGLVLWDAVATGLIFARPKGEHEQNDLLDSVDMVSPDRRGRPAAVVAHSLVKSLPSPQPMLCSSSVLSVISLGIGADIDGLHVGGIRVGLATATAVMVSGAYLALRVVRDTRRS